MKHLIIIASLIILVSCGKDDDTATQPTIASKFVYCTQEKDYKLCEVRLQTSASIFDQYTNTVLFGNVQEFNQMLSDNNSQTRLNE